MVTVNGENYDYAGLSVSEMLDKLGFFSDRIAVEINFEIVSKVNYASYILRDDDVVEVVSFVGGG